MTSRSEDVLLQVSQVRYKKGDGTLYLMSERLAWILDHKDTVNLSHRYADIKLQKISPEGKPKIQLQVVLHDNTTSTFQFVSRQGTATAIKERDKVKDLLVTLLPKFKTKVNKELEEKNRLLSENPSLLQLYRDLVITEVVTSEEFWASHASTYLNKNNLTKQDVGVSGAFLADIKPQTDGCNGLKYNLTSDVMEAIFRTYPAVRQKHQETVPHKFSEAQFWTKFFQSHYFHRDRINAGTKDLFTDCAKIDDLVLSKEMNDGVNDPLVDISSFEDTTLGEGYGTSQENSKAPVQNIVHQNMIKRFNQHSIMVLKACQNNPTTSSVESAIQMNGTNDSKGNSPHKREDSLELNYKNRKRKIHDKITYDDLESTESLAPPIKLNLTKVNEDFLLGVGIVPYTFINIVELFVKLLNKPFMKVRLGVPSIVTKPGWHEFSAKCWVERYLQGPASSDEPTVQPVTESDLPLLAQALVRLKDEVANYPLHSSNHTLVAPTVAVNVLGELTPGGALMRSHHEESLAELVSEPLAKELRSIYASTSELLRHFWACFPPTSTELQTKAEHIYSALRRLHSARIKPFEGRVMVEFSPLSQQLTSHLNLLLNTAYNKYEVWQSRRKQLPPLSGNR